MKKHVVFAIFTLIMLSFPTGNAAELPISGVSIESNLPLWYDKNGYTDEGRRAIHVLERSGKHGIDSERYLARLPKLDAAPMTEISKIQSVNDKVTKSLVLHLMDLKFGVTKTKEVLSKLTEEEKLTRQLYFQKALKLIAEEDAEDVIAEFENKTSEYKTLQKSLELFKEAKEASVIEPIQITKSIKLNDTSPEIAKIRSNIAIIESLKEGNFPSKSNNANLYDEALFDKVKSFQEEHRLEASSTIGKQTAEKINNYLNDAVDQISLAMEKIRTESAKPNGKYILVNIPEFKLYAYENGELKFTMPVIVGAAGNPTPEFVNGINNIVINPDWTPTHRITRNELLPKIRRNPNFLKQSGYEVTWLQTNEVIPRDDYGNVDWGNVDASQIKIRQPSGRGNALGNIKFLMPNSDSIYLHDTSSRELFKNSYRALSHGCIRLGEPMKLAEFVLGEEEYKKQNIEKIAGRGGSRHIKIDNFPVYVTYKTAWSEGDKIKLVNDVYNKSVRYKKIVQAETNDALIASVSPTYPSSYWANINVDEVAFAVKPNTSGF